MNIKELLDKAGTDYNVSRLETYYDEQGNFIDNPVGGDTLARFIVLELIETFDTEATDEDQILEAIRVMENARGDIQNVINALYND